jgi:macrolide-specific efflux system membrane fusion protein
MTRLKKTALFVIIPAIVAGTAAFLFSGYDMFNRNNRIRPRVGPIVEAVYALGTVRSDSVYNLKMGVAATVKRLYVIEGQRVKGSSPLVAGDTGMVFRAPFGGTVTKIHCEEGEVVMPGAPLLTLMDLNRTYVLLSLDQNSALRMQKDMKAQLSFETLRGKLLHGTVESIYPSNGQFLARINVKEIPPGILPEMTADVAIEVSRKEKALLVPLSSVNEGMVTVLRNGKKRRSKVVIGAVDGAWGEVLEGDILPADWIILNR